MTISQARLWRTVTAAKEILAAYEDKLGEIASLLSMLKRSSMTADQFASYLHSISAGQPLTAERVILAEETGRYLKTSAKNEREQHYRRARQGTPMETREKRRLEGEEETTHQLSPLSTLTPEVDRLLVARATLTDAERREIAIQSELMGLTETARALEHIGLDPTAGLTSTYRWNGITREVELASRPSMPTEDEPDWGSE